MVSINYAFKEIISKIVYYGPGLSGKTTNLQHVFKKVPSDTRGELISLATDADRTLYFDFLPVNVGNIKGFQVKFQLYTVPGQVYYNATRKLVLRGVDGLVFVADSQTDKMDENIESLRNLEENLAEYGYKLDEMPFIIQYNKRDLPNIAPIEELQAQLNPRNVPYFEAVATSGSGVFATLKAISKIVIEKAQKSSTEKSESKTAVVAAASESGSPKQKPEPEPVAASAGAKQPSQPQMEAKPKAIPETKAEAPEPAPQTAEIEDKAQELKQETSPEQADRESYGELPENSTDSIIGENTEVVYQEQPKRKSADKPAIMRESELMTNVVVSDTPQEVDESGEIEQEEDIEETTEHAVLKDEAEEVETSSSSKRHHPDILDADKLDFLKTKQMKHVREIDEEDAGQSRQSVKIDEEEVADPKQTGQSFTKPQMAESKKVKGKNKPGLFGWLKKK